MKPTCLLPIAICALTLSIAAPADVAGPRVISLRELPLLFADDSGIASSIGVIRTVHPAHQRSAPVIKADRPWESGRVYIYGSVYRDEATGLFRMWYFSRLQTEKDVQKIAVSGFRAGEFDVDLYATSADGLRWHKPALGMYAFNGSKQNNIIFDLNSPSVLLDPRDPDPARRYKMLGVFSGNYYAAVSPDGLHWTRYPDDKPILKYSDNICLTQDPTTGDYLAFHRRPTNGRIRTISLSRSPDFKTWSEPELVFAPDAEDNAWVKNPVERTEVYNLSVFPHAAGFISMPTLFRVLAENRTPKPPVGQSPVDGTIDVQLMTSENGRVWQRTQPRMNVISRGAPGSFDGGSILGLASNFVDAGDETWVYYTGLTTTHGGPIPPKRLSIGRAEWRRHGFVSLDAGIQGRLETKPLQLGVPALVINADARGGELRVGLLEADGRPVAGLALEDSEVLQADATRWLAKWRSTAAVPTDRPVRVVLSMKQCRLFSLSSQITHSRESKP